MLHFLTSASLVIYWNEMSGERDEIDYWKEKREHYWKDGGSRPEVFLGKGVLKICSKFTGERPCRSVISLKLQFWSKCESMPKKIKERFYLTFGKYVWQSLWQ